jgi:helix-turn-helix protein
MRLLLVAALGRGRHQVVRVFRYQVGEGWNGGDACLSVALAANCRGALISSVPRQLFRTTEGFFLTTVIQAYRFALDPTPRQRPALASHCGAARFAYNWGLHLVKQRLEERQTDPIVQVPWTLPQLRLEWNRAKGEVAPW